MDLSPIGYWAVLLHVACAASTRPASGPDHDFEQQPIPADLANDVEQAARLGRLIHTQDGYAARATDAVLHATSKRLDPRLRGWVVTEERASQVVTFIGMDGSEAIPLYRVRYSHLSPVPSVEVLDPGAPVTPEQLTLFTARQTAIGAPFRPCSKAYNTVILPASLIGKPGFLVYLIPGTTTPGLVLIGGHYRVRVSADGRKVLEIKPFSKSCLAMPPASKAHGEQHAVAIFTHLVTEAPVESHVYLSLLHRKPMIVGTSRGAWQVVGDRVSYHGPLE